jgi:hypothetical protein
MYFFVPSGVSPNSPAERFKGLSREEFCSVFKMTHKDFKKMLTWKQNNLKKSKGLF